jgi:hypothetical protein
MPFLNGDEAAATRAALESTHIITLQSAARMAGLRWKTGTPGYDKAGIVDKLCASPSIARAAVSVLRRMNHSNIPAPNPFAEALLDPPEAVPPTPAPVPSAPSLNEQSLREDIDSIRQELTTLRLSDTTQTHSISKLSTQVVALDESLKLLSARPPIQFNFPDHSSAIIDPTEHHELFPRLIKYLQINRRVILPGSAGTGKSMAVRNAAKALELPFYLQSPVTMSHELIGHRDATGAFHETPSSKPTRVVA